MRAGQAAGSIDAARLTDELRTELFAPAGLDTAPRIGAEIEFIPVDAITRRRCPIVPPPIPEPDGAPATLPVLRAVARAQGWSERPSPYGAPVFAMPDGGAISYEPGGQIEYSAPASASVTSLVARLRATAAVLAHACQRAGIGLVAAGIDPENPVDDVPLQLHGPRYVSMDAYLATIGSAGARMMRQTAALQVTIDAGADPARRWRLASALAPYLTAIFANSPREAGARTGWQSTRAATWRRLDRTRTGLPGATADGPATPYTAFALAARAILRRGPGGEPAPFGELLASGHATHDDWGPHLTTLFPDVRPRRIAGVPTFELRSIDAVPPEWYAAPIVVIAGLAYDDRAAAEAAALLRLDRHSSHTSSDLLVPAARDGLRDQRIRRLATDLYDLALRGAGRLGATIVAPSELEVAHAFGAQYVRRGRSLADDVPAGRAGTSRPDIPGVHAAASD